MCEMTIRSAGQDDARILAGLIRESHRDVADRFQLTRENCPKHPSFCDASWIDEDLKRGVSYFFLEERGEPLGCVALERASEQEVYLERLSVLPEKRRMGAGMRLVGHVLAEAVNLGAESLGVGIISEFAELKSWYSSLGFEEVRVTRFDHLPFEVCFMDRCVPVTM